RGRFVDLLAQQALGKVPTDHNDLRGPGDAGAAPQRPTAVEVAAVRGVDGDGAPARLAPAPGVNAGARGAAPPRPPGPPEVVDHGPSTVGEIRKPKHEIRNKCQIPKTNDRNSAPCRFGPWDFGFGVCFGFRISCFGFGAGGVSPRSAGLEVVAQPRRAAV